MRFTVFDRWGTQKGVVDDAISAIHKDELNGEDSLTLTTTSCGLIKGDRIVWRDKFGVWHEHVVNEVSYLHENNTLKSVVYAETSMNEMYLDYIVELRPEGVNAATAMQRALSVTRWAVGTVEPTGTASTSFYHISAREALTKVVENWGGELQPTITVSGPSVVGRSVSLLNRRGADGGKRFEWTKDIQRIERRVYPDDVVTALYGYGKGLEVYDSDGELTGGYTRRLTFGEINNGLDYVYDDAAKATWGTLDANGVKQHAFGKVEFNDCDDMEELLELTTAELQKLKQPQVTYTASVIDLADLGYDFEDVRTGDTVAIVDNELNERLQGRVLCVKRDLFQESATVITLGNITRSINDVISSTKVSVNRLNDHSSAWDGAASLSSTYVNAVINNLNTTMNVTGGYTYMEPGEGIITYDRARDDDPTMAIQITGAGFRIANSKNSQGEWNWRAFGTGDGFTADEMIAGTLNAQLVDVINLNADNINSGTLDSERIAARSITVAQTELDDYVSIDGGVLTLGKTTSDTKQVIDNESATIYRASGDTYLSVAQFAESSTLPSINTETVAWDDIGFIVRHPNDGKTHVTFRGLS